MQSSPPFYARYAQHLLPPQVPPYAQHPPPPPPYVYQQYPTYPPVSYAAAYPPTLLQNPPPQPYNPPNPPTSTALYPPTNTAAAERDAFYRKLHVFRDALGEPIQRLPTLGFKELDLWVLYKEVTKRHGIDAVIAKKQWKEVAEALQLPSSCTDSGFRLRLHYKKYLEAFERKFYTPPIEVEVRERKSKKKSSASAAVSGNASGGGGGSESAETDVGGGEDSSASADKGSEGKDRRTQNVKRKKRVDGGGKREKKKAQMEGESEHRMEVDTCTETGQAETKVETGQKREEVKKNEAMGTSGMEDKNENKSESRNQEEDSEKAQSSSNQTEGVTTTTTPAPAPASTPVSQPSATAASPTDQARHSKRSPPAQPRGVVEQAELSGPAEREAAHVLVWTSSGVSSGGVEKRRRTTGTHQVDFTVLDCATLKRYARRHAGGEREAAVARGGKGALAEWVGQHFRETPLVGGETATLLRFIQAVRRR